MARSAAAGAWVVSGAVVSAYVALPKAQRMYLRGVYPASVGGVTSVGRHKI